MVVAHDRDLFRIDADELAHFEDLLESAGHEQAQIADQALLPALLRAHEHRRLLVDVDRVAHAVDRLLVRRREHDLLAALDARDAC